MLTRSKLAIQLSKLKTFSDPKLIQEQYSTDSEVASAILWNAYMNGDIDGKTVADFGAGTGILGIGAMLLGAKKVIFVENDTAAIQQLRENLTQISGEYEIVQNGVEDVHIKTDIVIQNPPFGTKTKHADTEFLLNAFQTAQVVYSLHKTATIPYLKELARKKGYTTTHEFRFELPIKQQFAFHKKRIHRIDITCLRFISSEASS